MTDAESKEVVGEGKWVRLVRRDGWEWAERVRGRAIVGIVAMTTEGKMVLVDQYRPAVGKRVIEIPAGLVGDVEGEEDEDIEEAARRELEEETGYRAGEITFLFDGFPSAGITDEEIRFYLARDVEKVGDGGGDEHEEIVVHEVLVKEVEGWLKGKVGEGCGVDAKVYGGMWFLRQIG